MRQERVASTSSRATFAPRAANAFTSRSSSRAISPVNKTDKWHLNNSEDFLIA